MSTFSVFKWLARGLAVAIGLTLVWSASVGVRAQDAAPSGILSRVPADAAAFVHVKTADLWKAECSGLLRELIAQAGADAVTAFNNRFVPAPGTLESAVAFVLPAGEDGPGAAGMYLAFSPGFDQNKVVKSLMPTSDGMDHFGTKYTIDRTMDLALRIVDNKTLLISRKKDMPRLLAHEAGESGAMKSHLVAAAGKAIYAVCDPAGLPASCREGVPESAKPLMAAKTVVMIGEAGKDLQLKANLKFADGSAAVAGEKALRDLCQALREHLSEFGQESEKKMKDLADRKGLADVPDVMGQMVTMAASKMVDKFLADPPVRATGEDVAMEVRFDPSNAKFASSAAMVMFGVVKPAAQRMQMAAGASEGQNNLKQIAIAMHNYASAYNHFPTAIFSKDGKKPLLSWRVALLPYMEQNALYKQFKLDEPWDSDANKPLLAKMPKVFADMEAPPSKEPGMTHYQVFVGGGATFRMTKEGTRLFDITDGMSNTVMIVTAADPIAWTKPGDLPYSSNKPVAKLGFGGGKKVNVAMCDGSVRQIPANATVNVWRALITMAGGELIGDDF